MTCSTENILIVDDNRDNLKVLVCILQSAGYAVRPAHSGAVAFSAIKAKTPDLILLDILMPEMSGYEVCEQLKSSPVTRDIPVIFISALGQVNDKIKAFSKGAVDYITKPFQEEEVLARVETHLKLRRLNRRLERRNKLLKKEISRRKKAEKSLRESEEKYRSAFETDGAVKMIVDPENGGIVDANQAACAFYGYPADRLLEMNIMELHTFPPGLVESEMRKAVSGEKRRFEFRHALSSGPIRNVEVYAGPVNIGGKKLLYCIIHDVTDRKMLEMELEQVKKFEAAAILAGGVAHDFSNLLTIIGGGVELLKMNSPEKKKKSHLKNVEEALEKAKRLVRRFIDFSSGNGFRMELIDVGELLEKVRVDAASARVHGIDLHVRGTGLKLKADKRRILAAFSNLVRNAGESMPDGGRVDIFLERVDPGDLPPEFKPTLKDRCYVKITIRDKGSGISPKNLERIFDPYFSTKQKSARKGTGLGMTSAYSVIRGHGGAIKVRSRQEKGTDVSVYLPGINS